MYPIKEIQKKNIKTPHVPRLALFAYSLLPFQVCPNSEIIHPKYSEFHQSLCACLTKAFSQFGLMIPILLHQLIITINKNK